MSNRIRALLLGVAAVAVVLIAVLVVLPRVRPHVFHGMIIQNEETAPDIALTDTSGKIVYPSDFQGKLVALYFGYTFCPDACPTTLAALAQARRILGDKAKDVQVVMVTIDPERDTPERLGEYVQVFDPTNVGLTGSPDEIASMASAFGIFYEKVPVEGEAKYLMDHTATTTVLDREGRVRLVWPYNTSPEFMADDLKALLR